MSNYEAIRIVQSLMKAYEALDELRDAATQAYVQTQETQRRRADDLDERDTATLRPPAELLAWRELASAINDWRNGLFDEDSDAKLATLIRLASERIES